MKPFNLERALAGDPVVTRGGKKVVRIAHFPEIENREARLIVLLQGGPGLTPYCDDGRYWGDGRENFLDLFMVPKKRTIWLNIYPRIGCGGNSVASGWESKEDADRNFALGRIGGEAFPYEIEE